MRPRVGRHGRSRRAFLVVAWLGSAIAFSAGMADERLTLDFRTAAGDPALIVVAGEGLEPVSGAVRVLLRERLGVDFEERAPADVLEPANWRFREAYRDRGFLLLGNVHNNRAIFALFSRYLAGANRVYPGPGRYELRTVFQPFDRGQHMLVLGASDSAGLDAAVRRLGTLLDEQNGRLDPRIELGPDFEDRPVSPFGTTAFITAATRYYWQGDPGAGERAVELLRADLDSRERGIFFNLEGSPHYHWERNFRPLLQLLASGILTGEPRARVEARMLDYALHNRDGYTPAVLGRGDFNRRLRRHDISALTGLWLLYEYLERIGETPDAQREAVSGAYRQIVRHVESLLETGRFSVNHLGIEGNEAMNNLAALYLHLGDGRAVSEGLFRQMAETYIQSRDSRSHHVGDDAYITCRPGGHFSFSHGGLTLLLATFFHPEGGYRWLLDHPRHFLQHLGVRVQPDFTGLAATVPPVDWRDRAGLYLSPVDPYWRAEIRTRRSPELLPTEGSDEGFFRVAVLRDGFDPEHAFWALQGVNQGGFRNKYLGLSVLRYIEHGSLLLFSNSMRPTSWARSGVSSSRGANDPQSSAARLEARLNTPLVSAVAGVLPASEGVRWQRAVVRRHHGYFVVLDRMTALHDDVYNFTCRWRSFHQGGLRETHAFEAVDAQNGVRLRIASAQPVHWDIAHAERDGAARPTLVRQFRQARLDRGEPTFFQNLVHAVRNSDARAYAIRALDGDAVLVRGEGADPHVAAIGTGALDLPSLRLMGGLWYIADDGLAIASLQRMEAPGAWTLTAEGAVTVMAEQAGTLALEPGGADPVLIEIEPAEGVVMRIDGDPAEGGIQLPPGVTRLTVDGWDARLRAVADELRARWTATAPPSAGRPPQVEMDSRIRFEEVWSVDVAEPPPARHGRVRVAAEPEPDIGEIAIWNNRLTGPPSGLGWHGSERAGWHDEGGRILLDLGESTPVREIRLVRSRRRETEEGAFIPGEFHFDLEWNDEGFDAPMRTRRIETDTDRIRVVENVAYTYSQRLPEFVVPVGETARYLRITPQRRVPVQSMPGSYYGNYRDGEVSFMEIEVYRDEPEDRAPAGLTVRDFGSGAPTLLHEADGTLRMFNAAGHLLWTRELGAPLATHLAFADTNGDGQTEIVSFTLDDRLTVTDAAGGMRKDIDFYALAQAHKTGPETGDDLYWYEGRQAFVHFRPNALAAWRPDGEGRMEYLLPQHYRFFRVRPDGSFHFFPGAANHLRGGRFALPVPDLDGDGRDDLALVGTYGLGLRVLSSGSNLEAKEVVYAFSHNRLTGHSSGNNELHLFFRGLTVRDRDGRWLGLAAVNPGGIDAFDAEPSTLRHRWGRFHFPSNHCTLPVDLTDDGVPEILVGREDGYVLAYAWADGSIAARAALDGTVRALAGNGAYVAAGTDNGLFVLDRSLRVIGHRPEGVEALAFVETAGGGSLLAVAHRRGRLTGYRLSAGGKD